MDVRRSLPLSGIVFVVLLLLAIVGLGGDTPDTKASADDVMSFYGDAEVRQGIASFVLAASAPFLVFFGLSFASRLPWAGGNRRSVWERVLVAGCVLTAGATLVGALLHFALVDGADQGISPTALQALNALDANAWLPFNSGLGVTMLGAAGLLLAGTRIPRWLGWTALVLGIALFIPFADFFALILGLIWILVVSVILFRIPAQDEHEPVAAPG